MATLYSVMTQDLQFIFPQYEHVQWVTAQHQHGHLVCDRRIKSNLHTTDLFNKLDGIFIPDAPTVINRKISNKKCYGILAYTVLPSEIMANITKHIVLISYANTPYADSFLPPAIDTSPKQMHLVDTEFYDNFMVYKFDIIKKHRNLSGVFLLLFDTSIF